MRVALPLLSVGSCLALALYLTAGRAIGTAVVWGVGAACLAVLAALGLMHEPLSSRIDWEPLAELTAWRGGDLDARTSSWRYASWRSIIDFYQSVRTPEELAERIEREQPEISFEEIVRLDLALAPAVSEALRRQLLAQYREGRLYGALETSGPFDLTPILSAEEQKRFKDTQEILDTKRVAEAQIERLYWQRERALERNLSRAKEQAAQVHYANPEPWIAQAERAFADSMAQLAGEKKAELAAVRERAQEKLDRLRLSETGA